MIFIPVLTPFYRGPLVRLVQMAAWRLYKIAHLYHARARETCRPTDAGAHQVRDNAKPDNGESPRPDRAAGPADRRRRGARMTGRGNFRYGSNCDLPRVVLWRAYAALPLASEPAVNVASPIVRSADLVAAECYLCPPVLIAPSARRQWSRENSLRVNARVPCSVDGSRAGSYVPAASA
jgi:hypothetical protein